MVIQKEAPSSKGGCLRGKKKMADEVVKNDVPQNGKEVSGTEPKESKALPAVDDKKVQTAVKFLQNPKVRKTSFEKRITFLRNKGLTEDEINIALKKSGTERDKEIPYQDDTNRTVSTLAASGGTSVSQVPQSSSGSFLSYLASVIIGGGIVYSAGYLIQNYILPYLYGKKQDDTKQLEKSIRELSEGVTLLSTEMRNALKVLEDQFKEQQTVLNTVSKGLEVTKARVDLVPSDVTSLSDVKSEIASVKGLLLGRRQFPPSPFVAPSSSPSIPAWQKASQKKTNEKTAEKSEQNADEQNTERKPSSPEPEGNTEYVKSLENDKISENLEHNNGSFVSDQVCDDETPVETKNNESLVSNESFEQGVEEINNLNSLSSTYVKLNTDSDS